MDFIGGFLGGRQGGQGNRGGYNSNNQMIAHYQDFLDVIPAYLSQKPDLNGTAKVLLPADVLQQISQFQFPIPMLFCITNTYTNKKVFLGVQEFTASPHTVVLPQQFYDQLGCFDGCQVGVSLVTDYKKGKYVKIQPHETAFIDLPNPKAILEHELPQFVQFLSKDQVIEIKHMEVKPDDESHTICIVDTDVNIDFAPPLDYVEEAVNPLQQITKKTASQIEREQKESKKFVAFQGGAVRIDNKAIDQKKLKEEQEKLKQQSQQKDYDPRKFKLKHGVRQNLEHNTFSGSGVTLGKGTVRYR